MSENLYKAENLVFWYPRSSPAIDHVNFRVSEGEFVALIGPNGSGKSTLLKLLMGLLKPQEGEIKFLGKPLEKVHPRALAREVAYLPQEDEIHFPFTVGEVVMLGRWPHSRGAFFDSPIDKEASARAMAKVGIEQWSGKPVTELSGGERAMVMLAKAIATEPRCFLLDEPAGELDLKHAFEAYRLLRELADSGSGVVVVSHDVGAVSRWADRVVLLCDGRVLADGKPEEVLDKEKLREAYGVGVKVVTDGMDRAVFASMEDEE